MSFVFRAESFEEVGRMGVEEVAKKEPTSGGKDLFSSMSMIY